MSSNVHAHINAVQAPTAALLAAHSANLISDYSVPYEKIVTAVSDWLGENFSHLLGQAEGQPPNVSQANVLMASVRLWCDLCLPTSLQYAYEPKSNSAMLDSSCASRIFGLAGRCKAPELKSLLRFEDLAISVTLNRQENLFASPPQRAVGLHPRVFVCLKPPQHENRVVKARLTVMARLLCQAFLLISQNPTEK